jgi:glutamine cyclotransferase
MQSELNQMPDELAGVEVHGVSRQSFILKGALAAGAVYGLSAVTPFVGSALAATSDVDILNFALTLEYLETNFYKVKGASVGLSGEAKSFASTFGAEEAEHVTALTGAIKSSGGTPVKSPTFSFPVTNQATFLTLAYTLENIGVAAYNGAGPSLASKKLLAAAGSIVQVEARHAATIGLLTNKSPVPNGAFDNTMTMAQVLKAAGPLITKS